MTLPGTSQQFFHTSAELQEFLLTQPPGVLVIVPQMRLAHQVWRRQRLAAREKVLPAWEPVAMTTLSGWLHQLWHQLWLPVRLATVWERLMVWVQAMEATPLEPGVTVDLAWAAQLDEAFDLCQRYRLPAPTGSEAGSLLISWRQAVYRHFSALLEEHGLINSAAVPGLLLAALRRGELALPEHIVLVGLETPAPVEQEWLQEVARQLGVTQVHLAGRQEEEVTLKGRAFPDRRQELEWVAAQVLDLAYNQGVPLHRLAVTAPGLENYLPDLRRLWQELLGPAVTETGGSYNFSLGPKLSETLLFQAALLPLTFIAAGEQRQDLVDWLRSPYYGAFGRHENNILRWDLAWRQYGLVSGWDGLRQPITQDDGASPNPPPPSAERQGKRASGAGLLGLVDQALSLLPRDQAPAALWLERLREVWQLLEFPRVLGPEEAGQWQVWRNLLDEFAAAGGERLWTVSALMEWLSWGAARLDLASEGSMDAGVQIQGLLELRGLDFDAVFCLGLNMGTFPPPPRQLSLLTGREKALVLGGDYQSQRVFAETSYRYLLAAAPALFLTRPLVDNDEDQLASYILPPTVWEKEPTKFNALSQVHPAWLRSPAVRAAFQIPVAGLRPDSSERIFIPLPEQISLSDLETALTCPCRFYLTKLLGLEELPDLGPGLEPSVRGSVIHQVLQAFTCRFQVILQNDEDWDEQKAAELLREAASAGRPPNCRDPHWQAEVDRWLEGEEALLTKWLDQERQRFLAGWRWQGMEAGFAGLELPGWPTRIKGRLDRVDRHETGGLMIWDYKTGELYKKNNLTEERDKFQLAGYLLAVQQGLVNVQSHPQVRAGCIGLKSSRDDHLKFEDFNLGADDWRELVNNKLQEVSRIGSLVGEGDFRADPCQPPTTGNSSCQYCPFKLLCGYQTVSEVEPDAELEE